MLKFLTKYFRFWPFLAGVALAGLWIQHNAALRNEGALRERNAELSARNAQLEDQTGRIDTVYHTDTLRLAKAVARYNAYRDTLRITDTVQVRALIALADSTVHVCSAALLTCETRVALRDQRIAVLDSLNHVLAKQKPGFIKRRFGCAAGVGATTSGAGLGAACGVKFP